MKPAAFAAALVLSACASATPGSSPAPKHGYLTPLAATRLAAATPSPIADPSDEATVFETVQPQTDRWWLAIMHIELRPPEAKQHFDCALGTRLTAKSRPALDRVMSRLALDTATISAQLARRNPRARPLSASPSLEPCQRVTNEMRQSPSWPAQAAMAGAAWGELMADLAPDRAEAVRRIGREIGLSRVVCRMNWPSDVRDGAEIGRNLYAAVETDPVFRADLDAARVELAVARSEGLTSAACAAERRALGLTPVAD